MMGQEGPGYGAAFILINLHAEFDNSGAVDIATYVAFHCTPLWTRKRRAIASLFAHGAAVADGLLRADWAQD